MGGLVAGGLDSGIAGQLSSLEGPAQADALTGFNYLLNDPLNQSTQANATTTNNDVTSLLTNGTSSPAFQNYLDSTGYNFELGAGTQALDQNAATRGLLNSGGTAKDITSYGQNLMSTTFNNYLNQLNSVTAQGLTSQGIIGQAGTAGGVGAASALANLGGASASAEANANAQIGSGVNSIMSMAGGMMGGGGK